MTEFGDNLDEISRNNLALYIYGNLEFAYLKTENIGSGKSGVYKDKALQISGDTDDGVKISTVGAGLSDELKLVGISGKRDIETDTAIKNDFVLILKVKKSTN